MVNYRFSTGNLIGYSAVVLGVFAYIPVLLKIWRTGITVNFTYLNIALAVVASSLWITQGFFDNVAANIISGFIHLTIYAFILYFKFKDDSPEEITSSGHKRCRGKKCDCIV